MITHGKKNTDASKRQALKFFFVSLCLLQMKLVELIPEQRNHTIYYPSSSDLYENDIKVDLVATHVYFALSQ